ncbi:MAG: hypothetical protein CME26_11775 [Gemmatimonadetes bacterium]|nr:hypothetical protein [Gemmatimonadota bacterium]
MDIKVTLCDKSPQVVEAWRNRFIKNPEVEIVEGDIFDLEAGAVVIPGNSFGYLDRGIELQAGELFGFELQDHLREKIRSQYNGELLVGQGFLVPCSELFPGKSSCSHLAYISATRTPGDLTGSLNSYLAARGAFMALSEAPGIDSIVLPGIGTGTSGIAPEICARQMRYAYKVSSGLRGYGDKSLTQLTRRESKLRRMPKPPAEDLPQVEGEAEPG